MPIVQKLGLGIADLTNCVAKLSLNLSLKSNVVVRTVESMNTNFLNTPSQKKLTLNLRFSLSNVAFPDWPLN